MPYCTVFFPDIIHWWIMFPGQCSVVNIVPLGYNLLVNNGLLQWILSPLQRQIPSPASIQPDRWACEIMHTHKSTWGLAFIAHKALTQECLLVYPALHQPIYNLDSSRKKNVCPEIEKARLLCKKMHTGETLFTLFVYVQFEAMDSSGGAFSYSRSISLGR